MMGLARSLWVVVPLLLLLVVHLVSGDDEQCNARLGKIQPCITFIEGKSDLPGSRCCRGLQNIYLHSPVCLCELLSSTGGLASTPGVNVTNAVMLPSHCNLSSNTSSCTALLEQASSSSGRNFHLLSLVAAMACLTALLTAL